MKTIVATIFVVCLGVMLFVAQDKQTNGGLDSKRSRDTKKVKKIMKVSGEFETNLKPLDSYAMGENGVVLGRMSIEKTFSGGLTGASKGEMLTAMTPVKGSAGYTAIEQFSGSLSGKKGSFVLQHFATMQGEENFMRLEIVPDSGTGDLEGLSGKMIIRVEDGKHLYDFGYELE